MLTIAMPMIMHRYLKNTPGCPQANWQWLGCSDLKEDQGLEFDEYEECEFCGKEHIRFVHSLKHPDWRGDIRVGRICAARYTRTSPTELASAEAVLKNRSQRRQRFPRHKSWKISVSGNRHIEYADTHILIMKKNDGFKLKVGNRWGHMTFKSEKDAMLKAFDVVTHQQLRSQKQKNKPPL